MGRLVIIIIIISSSSSSNSSSIDVCVSELANIVACFIFFDV